MRVISFLSQKGGCGKTTSCVNLAVTLAGIGRRVLIIDLDSNACASRTFEVVAAFENSVAAALAGEHPLAEIIRPTGLERVWLAPGTTNLSLIEKMDIQDSTRADGQGRLEDIALALELEQLKAEAFDYVFVDCPGGNLFMARLALLASTEVIVPTGLSIYDLYAGTPTLQLILMAQEIRGGDAPAFLGFLPNGAGKSGLPRKIGKELEAYAMPWFTPVRNSALMKSIASAPKVPLRIMVSAHPGHPVTASYLQVAREIEMGIEAARAEVASAEMHASQPVY
jgi:chromosome partitioning protein